MKKIIGIFLCILLIFTATVLPATTSYTNVTIVEKWNKSIKVSNIDNIGQLYEEILKKISTNKNPFNELVKLLSYPEIKQTIRDISDNETLETSEILFSEKNSFYKIMKVNQYNQVLMKKTQNQSIIAFENELTDQIACNYCSLENTSFMKKLDVTREDIVKLQSEWEKHLNTHHKLKTIMENTAINPILFFLVFSVVMFFWGGIYGIASVCAAELCPLVIMVTEALIVGLACSYAVGTLMGSNDSFVNLVVSMICDLLPCNQEQVLSIISSLTCLVMIGSFVFLWEISTTIQALGAWSMVVGPPLLIALIASREYYELNREEGYFDKYEHSFL